MSDVTGRTAVVFGASGNVGFGVAQALLRAGALVVAPTRRAESIETISAELGLDGLVPVVGDVSDPDDAFALAERIENDAGPVHHVVASLGPWWQRGRIVDQTPAEYRRVLRASLDAHVFAAQAFLRRLADRRGATYTLITGAGANMTVPGTGLLVIAVSGVLGLSRMLRAEHAEDQVRVNEVLIASRVERAPRDGVVTASDFGRAVLTEVLRSKVSGEVLEFTDPARFHVRAP